jgi:hypothetical protein
MSNLDRTILIAILISFVAAWIWGAIEQRRERKADTARVNHRARKQEVERAARKSL